MPIHAPGKHPAPRFEKNRALGGRKGTNADLQLTSMVDMFTLLVIFLLANFSATGDLGFWTSEIELPRASHGTELERAPVVSISDRLIGLDGQAVVAVDGLGGDGPLNLPALEDGLREIKKRGELVHLLDPGHRFEGKVVLQADRRTPFRLVKRVMFSCAAAGFGDIDFAVLADGK